MQQRYIVLLIQDQVAHFDSQRGADPPGSDAKTRSRFACPEPDSKRGIRLDQGRMTDALQINYNHVNRGCDALQIDHISIHYTCKIKTSS
ncbi:hypothetical protein [Limnobacter sp.]|uniref:hypothetical protein n=1 Tax=Limnobacter sp. TaxID=2003368 RepID=UPI00311FEA8D